MNILLLLGCFGILALSAFNLILAQTKEKKIEKDQKQLDKARENIKLEAKKQQELLDVMKDDLIEYVNACERDEEPEELKL